MSTLPPLSGGSGLGNLGGPTGLGSLAQSARKQHLNGARNILIAIGVLDLLIGAAIGWLANGPLQEQTNRQIDQQVNEGRARGEVFEAADIQAAKDEAIAGLKILMYIMVGMGVLYIVLGCLVQAFPVPATMTGLVVYVGTIVAGAAMDPSSLLAGGGLGIVLRIAITVGLFRAVKAALAYQKDLKRVEGKPMAGGLGADL